MTLTPAATSNLAVSSHIECGIVVVGPTDAFSNFKSRARSVEQCFYKQNLLRIHQKNVILQGIFHSKT